MPVYEYRCADCGAPIEVVRSINDRANAPICCGKPAQREFRTAPSGYVDNMESYKSPVTGEPITTRRQRQYEMEKGNYIDANDFKNTWKEQRAQREADKAEVKRLKEEMPKDLKNAMQQITKAEEAKFKSNL